MRLYLAWKSVAAAAFVLGCHRQLPSFVGCTPGVYRCAPTGMPEVCSGSYRFEPAGDAVCSCRMSDAGVASCAPLHAGGLDVE